MRRLGTLDATLITVGSVIGSGIFLTTSDIARSLPSPGRILLVWALAGALSLTGALTYGELGAMFPHAGGMYHFLKEAYGRLFGFLFGWAGFLVIMSGGVAAISIGFGQYLGSFVPFFSTANQLLAVPIGGYTWTLSGVQVGAVLAILFLVGINTFGLRLGAGVQNGLTLLRIGAMALLAFGGLVLARAPAELPAAAASGVTGGGTGLLAALGVGLIAAMWTNDGWYGPTMMAGEMRDPGRSLPRGMLLGVLVVTTLYLLLNVVYLRALPIDQIQASPRIAEDATAALFGSGAGKLVSAMILFSTFGCVAATILYASRLYLAMAQDGVFFRALAYIHPVYRVPTRSLWAQGVWASLLALSGTYEQLYTYVVFASVLFFGLAGTAVFVLRRKRPDLHRPYRVWGYPVVPALFVASSVLLMLNTLIERPAQAGAGLALLALGLPAYWFWSRRGATATSATATSAEAGKET